MSKEFTTNPLAVLERVWKITEKVVVTLSYIMVVGTVGYLSIRALA